MQTTAHRPDAASAVDSDAPPVLVIMGVSGSGKTTVATLLAERLGWDRQEGDELHPAANVAKMASGQPLTDDDRWPWLDLVAEWIDEHRRERRPGVITCSALKHEYRDRLARPGVVFVHLSGGRATIADRLDQRVGHYMPASLLTSQFDTLEPLGDDETGIVVDAGQAPEAEADEILTRLGLVPLTE